MDNDKQRQEDLERIKKLRLFDDEFLNACFDDNIECTELVLRIILDDPDLTVKTVKTQKLMKNLQGRDTWLDIHASHGDNRESDIEIQRADKGAKPKRARYHSSIMDAHALKPNEDFDKLPETFVIFVTENDVLGGDKPLYRIERRIEETGERFGDDEHIIYVNGANQDSETALGKLMHDFSCTNPDEMYYKLLADRTRFFKETTEGVETMSSVLDEMKNETVEKVALNLLQFDKLTVEEIAESTGLTVERVRELAAQKSA